MSNSPRNEQVIPDKKIRLDQQKREDSKNTKSKTQAQDRLKKFSDPLADANETIYNANVMGTGLINPCFRPDRVNLRFSIFFKFFPNSYFSQIFQKKIVTFADVHVSSPQGMEQPKATDIEQDIPNKKIRLDHQQKCEDSKNTKSKTKAQDRLKKLRDPSSKANHQVVSQADIVQDIPIDVDVELSESDIVNQNVPVPMQIAPNDDFREKSVTELQADVLSELKEKFAAPYWFSKYSVKNLIFQHFQTKKPKATFVE